MGIVRNVLGKSVDFVRNEIMPVTYDLRKAGILSQKDVPYEQKSSLVDPYYYNSSVYGYKEKFTYIDYDKARQIAMSDPVISAIIQTRTNQVGSFACPQEDRYKTGFKVRMRDKNKKPSGAAKKKIEEIERFLMNCGYMEQFEDTPQKKKRDNFETFLRKITRDTLMFDQLNFEVIPRMNGMPAEFLAVDASTVRIMPDKAERDALIGGTYDAHNRDALTIQPYYGKQGQVRETKEPRYVQVIHGTPRATFDEWEMAFGIRNPRSDLLSNGYGYSEIEMLLTTITAHINADTYNRRFFCLPGETRIATSEGYIPIADVFKSQNFKSVWTGRNWTEYTVVKTGKKNVAKTYLEDGRIIKTSSDHRFRVYDGNFKLGWKKQSELKSGDFVISDTSGFDCGDCDISGKYGPNFNRDDVKNISISSVGEDLWEFFGWIMADGWIGNREVRSFYRGRDESYIRDRHIKILDSYKIPYILDDSPRDNEDEPFGSKYNRCEIRITGEFVNNFFKEAVGFSSGKFKGGHLPSSVFRASQVKRISFLKGLFSANGDCSGNNVKLTSCCKNILQDALLLLSSVGQQSYIVNSSDSFKLYVNQPEDFIKKIGFIQGYKIIDKERHTYGSHIDKKLLVDICRSVYGDINKRVGYNKNGELTKDVGQRSKLSDSALSRFRAVAYHDEGMSRLRLIEHLGDAGIDEYNHLLERGFVRVDKTEETDELVDMYDVSCFDDVHEFIAEGVVVHNSQGSSQKGILAFEGTVPPDQLEAFRRQWHQQISGVQNAWRTPIVAMGKDSKLHWVSLHSTNREMEWGKYIEYLIKTICGVYQIDPIEIGFDISRNTSGSQGDSGLGGHGQQVERLKYSRDKGLDPLLRFIGSLINDYLIWRLDEDFEFEFVGLNSGTEKDQIELDKQKVETFMTLDELRAQHDLPAMKDPEEVKTPGGMVMSQQFIQAYQAVAGGGMEEGMPGGPGGMPGGDEEGEDMGVSEEEEPDYENMSTEDLEKELAKLQGKQVEKADPKKLEIIL